MDAPGPKKGFFTLSEIVILSVVWGAASNLSQNIMKTGIGYAFKAVGLKAYTVDLLVALTLLAATFGMVLLFTNVDIGKRAVFELVDPIALPVQSADGALNYQLAT